MEGREERWVSLEVRDLGPELEIAVCDSGPGIPPEIDDSSPRTRLRILLPKRRGARQAQRY